MARYNFLGTLGIGTEVGGIAGMITTFPDAQPFNTAGYLFAASCALYGLGRLMSNSDLELEIKRAILLGERKELSDKL